MQPFTYEEPAKQNGGFFPTEYSVETAPSGQMHSRGSSGALSISTSYEDEPPLLEELGINFSHIWKKTLAVLNPLRKIDSHIMDDTDMAGPLVFALLLGVVLLLKGKVQFGYIYGVGFLGCISIYLLLKLMSETAIDFMHTTSVLGYCFLPIILLAVVSLVVELNDLVGYILAAMTVVWCTQSASLMFVMGLQMKEQRALIAYPIILVYVCFVMMALF